MRYCTLYPEESMAEESMFTRPTSIWYMVIIALPVCLSLLAWSLTRSRPEQTSPATGTATHCYHGEDVPMTCRHECSHGHFRLPWMTECLPWLKCDNIQSDDFTIGRVLGSGAVKVVRLSRWKGHDVVHNRMLDTKYAKDFKHGLSMLIGLQPSMYVTQLLGYCDDSFVTEYHSLGTAANIQKVLSTTKYKPYDTLKTRFALCLRYVEILAYLHNSPIGTRVMCDSNDLQKTLSQFLLTSDLSIVVNDLDALPEVNHSAGIKCGHRKLFGEFVAPEQLWPDYERDFVDSEMPSYDEKTDVWKIPDVCEFFIGDFSGSDVLRLHLFKVHAQCKREKPADRPTSDEVLERYRSIVTILQLV